MFGRASVSMVLACLTLAGCVGGDGGGGPSDGGAEAGPDAEGAIGDQPREPGTLVGVVVDAAIRPLEGATVSIARLGVSQPTTEEGWFRFAGLEPGFYSIQVSKPGFLDAFADGEVPAAGIAEPVKVVLQADAESLPYVVELAQDGFIECGVTAVAACGGINRFSLGICGSTDVCLGNVSNDSFSVTYDLVGMGVPAWMQTEMVWEATQPLAAQMNTTAFAANRTQMERASFTPLGLSTYGPSPLLTVVPGAVLQEFGIGNHSGVIFATYTGPFDGTYYTCQPTITGACHGVGATFQQSFKRFTHLFYGYLPPPEWRFSADGRAPAPPS
ncbi:MAG TPA: carboxypeptidase-like regulatory domain-containing protein [Candidatus Thermoplasmatota archaeon]|nr:carboxypeptidase-like regulatory domain-containing protein [Candidatus Thermoplasmatota archaeon]